MSIPPRLGTPAIRFERLWDRVMGCDRCLRDPRLVALDRAKFAPHRPISVMPPGAAKVPYLFVAMESSLKWAGGSRRQALALQRQGWRCFNNSPEDLTFHYAAQKWLLRHGEGYTITDLGKCALPVSVARDTQSARYQNCLPWLEDEVRILRPSLLIAVGQPAFKNLLRLRSPDWPPIASVLHWSIQNQMNVGRYSFANDKSGLPSERTFSAWRLAAYDDRSWHPEAGSRRERAGAILPYHLRLLAIYRRQFAAVRAVADRPTAANVSAAVRVGVRVAV